MINWVLEYCGLSIDNISSIFNKQLNNIADGIEHLDKINKSSDEDDNKSSNIINEMKKTHDNIKDSDIIKNSTPNYYIIAGIIITITAIVATIYFNPYGITDYLIGCYHSTVESIKQWTQSWVRPKYSDDDDNFFKRIRWSSIFTPWKVKARREELSRFVNDNLNGEIPIWDNSDNLNNAYDNGDSSIAGPSNINTEQEAFSNTQDAIRETAFNPEPLNDPFPFNGGGIPFEESDITDKTSSGSIAFKGKGKASISGDVTPKQEDFSSTSFIPWGVTIPDFIKGTTFEDSYVQQIRNGTPEHLIDIPRHLFVKKTGAMRVNPNSFVEIPSGESKVDFPKSNNRFDSLDPDQFI